jgi:hypothetical protein
MESVTHIIAVAAASAAQAAKIQIHPFLLPAKGK